MITFKQFLTEDETVTLQKATKLTDLIDPKTGKYYTGVVNVTGVVDINGNNLKKLPVKFGKVGGPFYGGDNQLISLEGAPSSVHEGFYCSNNQLTSLEGFPSTIGGAVFNNNKLTSLEGIHKIIKRMDVARSTNAEIWFEANPIKSGGIGLILIEGLAKIGADLPAFKIIEKYLGQGKKGVLLCQDELIEAGYEEFARL